MVSVSYEFFLKEDFSRYAGEWIGILDKKVVAHGASFKEVAEIADREFSSKKMLITRIPAKMAQLL